MTHSSSTGSGLTSRQQVWLAISLAVITLLGTVSAAVIANWNQLFPPNSQPASAQDSRVDGGLAVQNIYNLPEARGLQILRDQGFQSIRIHRVCSNSVAIGNVREVVLDNNAPVSDETALVNQLGSTGLKVPLETKLVVKISKGVCP